VTPLKPARAAEDSLNMSGGKAPKFPSRAQSWVGDNALAGLWVGTYAVILVLFGILGRLERAASRR